MESDRRHKVISLQSFDNRHFRMTDQYLAIIQRLYDKAIEDITLSAGKTDTQSFSFAKYPTVAQLAKETITALTKNVTVTVTEATEKQWLLANEKNDFLINSILDKSKLDKETVKTLYDKNLPALEAFQTRGISKGKVLSAKIWDYNNDMMDCLDKALELGIGTGKSAQRLSKDVREYLLDPNKLIADTAKEKGNLEAMKTAEILKPDAKGMYSSPVKNSMRLTRTETNMAYREADWRRWQNSDFVVGYEVIRSNREPLFSCPICESLAGRYPKRFKFIGWHPQCMCYAIPILNTREEFNKQHLNAFREALYGTPKTEVKSQNEITELPDQFIEWMQQNLQRENRWKNPPYFIRDNFKGGKMSNGLKFSLVNPVINKKEIQLKDYQKIPSRLASEILDKNNKPLNAEFFKLFDSEIKLEISDKGETYYSIPKRTIYFNKKDLKSRSSWYKESIIYHEYGHAIDSQRRLKYDKELNGIMNEARSILSEKINHDKYGKTTVGVVIDRTLRKMKYTASKDDLDKVYSTMDVLMSLDPKLGYGHTKEYYETPFNQETEFIAHAFENAFVGNEIMEQLMPDVYKKMIKYIRSLKFY